MEEARDLASRLDRLDDHLTVVLVSMPATMFAKGRFRECLAVMERYSEDEIAHLQEPNRIRYHSSLGIAYLHTGQIERSWSALAKARALDQERSRSFSSFGGAPPRFAIRAYAARNRAFAGDTNLAFDMIREMWELASSEAQIPSIAWAMQMRAWGALLGARVDEANATAEELLRYATKAGLQTRVANARVLLGRTQMLLGNVEQGLHEARAGLSLWRNVAGLFHCSELACNIAESLVQAGSPSDACEFIEYGERVQAECDECFCGPELMRLRGVWLASQREYTAARRTFNDAISAARAMGTYAFEAAVARDLQHLPPEH
jgi:hypothetical protein